MIKLFLLLALSAPPARAEFTPFGSPSAELPPMNFCAPGKFFIITGNCQLAAKNKDAINPGICGVVAGTLAEGLAALYPNASVEAYTDLRPQKVLDVLARPDLLGFFLLGEGDLKGGLVTGPELEKVYPDIAACKSKFDLFGGFTSHSKYSPSTPAPKAQRGLVLSRAETLYSAEGAVKDSWPELCKPRISLVYPTRTFAGRLQDDAKKLLGRLKEEKKKRRADCRAAVSPPSR